MENSSKDCEPDQLEEILRHLNTDDTQKVFLLGKSGVGKTWMAKEVCRHTWQQRSSYCTLWFTPDDYLSRRRVQVDYERRVVENVALQLSVYSLNGDCEEDEDDSEVWEREGLDKDDLKQRIQEKLEAMKSAVKVAWKKDGKPDASNSAIAEPKETSKSNQSAPPVATQEKEKYILVVLDALAMKGQSKITKELKKLLPFQQKYVITGIDGNERMERTGSENQNGNAKSYVHRMRGLSVQGSLDLLTSRLNEDVCASENFKKLHSAIRHAGSALPDERNSHDPGSKSDLFLPSMMVMLAEALKNAPRHTFEGVDHEECIGEWSLESAVEEAAGIFGSGDINKMVTLVYEMFPRNGVVTHCSWHSRHLFFCPRGMHSNELIAHWLVEGYFGDLKQIGMAFEEGHRTLMDLKERGILKEHGNSFIYLEGAEAKLHDRRLGAFHSTTRLGLADVMKDAEGWAGLGRTTLADGLIKTSYKKKEEISTLIIDGVSHLWRKFPRTYLSTMRSLRNLIIINPTFKELPLPLVSLEDIQVLVLRGCSALVNVDKLDQLENLLVLEISGASLLVDMKDGLFGKLKKIRSLNFSGAGFKVVPTTLMNLIELRWLILRDCKMLGNLPSLQHLVKLEVLDLSGSSNLIKLTDKNLSLLTKLQTLALCQTNMERLPYFEVLPKLSRLLLNECSYLASLTSFKKLNALEILDLSGAKSLKEVRDDFLENKPHLRVLDLSRSAVTKIPGNIEGLTHLLLKDCTGLETLPSTENMGNLQVLDLSGASSLVEIKDFHDPRELRDLILSGTKITKLPKFREGCKLRRLLLKNCFHLNELPNFEAFKSLEVLDLSGCSSLEIEGLSFRHMSSLKILNLSGTKLRSLPSDCFPNSLSQLIIRDCADLVELPAMESMKGLVKLDLFGSRSLRNMTTETLKCMTDLRVLNLSDVSLNGLPPMSHLTKLRELSLAGCSYEVEKLEDLTGLNLLNLSKTKRRSLPPLNTFPELRQLLLRDCSELKELKDLKALKNLEVLDIAGTKFALPKDITNLTRLRKLHLQEIKQDDWSKIKIIPEYFSWQKCDPASFSPDVMTSLVIGSMTFFHLLKENPRLWDSCFKKFRFSVWIPKEEAKPRSNDGVRHTSLLERNTGFPKDVITLGRIPPGGEYSRCLEIHGSLFPEPEGSPDEAPIKQAEPKFNHVKVLLDALIRAEHVSLIDNSSIEQISQIGDENLVEMKSLWLENCAKITHVIKRIKDVGLVQNLSSLYLLNLSSLTSMHNDTLEFKFFFPGLNTLHVECCPLPKIFDLSRLPENLKDVRVKFCLKMTDIFHCSNESAECKLQKLQLVELPKLVRIGISMPHLKELKLRGCPGVEDLEKVLGKAEYLEILHISDAATLKTISSGQESVGFQNLADLKIESCPKLTYIFSRSLIPKKLKSLDIKHCRELASFFDGVSSPGLLPSLTFLQLWNLPLLENFGGLEPPSGCSFRHWDCPKLPANT